MSLLAGVGVTAACGFAILGADARSVEIGRDGRAAEAAVYAVVGVLGVAVVVGRDRVRHRDPHRRLAAAAAASSASRSSSSSVFHAPTDARAYEPPGMERMTMPCSRPPAP